MLPTCPEAIRLCIVKLIGQRQVVVLRDARLSDEANRIVASSCPIPA
jgi:hypothetical protein